MKNRSAKGKIIEPSSLMYRWTWDSHGKKTCDGADGTRFDVDGGLPWLF